MSSKPIPLPLLPDSARTERGRLSIGGCDVAELAHQHGTPLFVYDEAHLRRRCREAIAAFGADAVAYASKAFLCTAMARLVHTEGLLIDVATGGELHVALAAGVPADRLILHGNNKDMTELARAIEVGVRRIVVDSFDELDRLDALYDRTAQRPKVALRVTPGVEAHTHEFVRTGQDDSKFGFGVRSGAAARAVARAHQARSVELVGLHMHIGSQVFDVNSFRQATEVLVPIVEQFQLPELTIGGGLGVAYVEGERTPSFAEWRSAVDAFSVHVTVEPGRAIVASSAVTLYTVGTIKEIPEIRTYVSVDGGMSDNPRPVLYGSGYEAFLPRAVESARPRPVRLVGKHCESGDVLINEAWLPDDLAVGDIVATPVTGAYGYSMASNYNKVPRPAVVFVRDGQARVVVRRETLDDLLRLDVG